MIYNKLVRDNIPNIIESEGFLPKTILLSDEQFLKELDAKLIEEVKEYQESKGLEELADIVEVIYAICNERGYTIEDLMKTKNDKYILRGGFSKKIFLVSKEMQLHGLAEEL